ncbi:response regulator [Dyella sp.]|jgi:DNA-binding NtrC family response regulator|uniref:response regulator n=1 Tax=Dyella sp. TaxID=1869338 RepID=UPI002D76C7F3|nr:response regulator [Dyella sp.]HET6433529.1 response regulator [Dyella sp.]
MGAEKVVLIVDDDPSVLETMRILLEGKGGFRVHGALGSHSAQRLLGLVAPDVLIADVVLAGETTGIDVCEEALRMQPELALVVISADSRADAAVMPRGSVYLRKPFGGVELLGAIDAAVQRARARSASDSTI